MIKNGKVDPAVRAGVDIIEAQLRAAGVPRPLTPEYVTDFSNLTGALRGILTQVFKVTNSPSKGPLAVRDAAICAEFLMGCQSVIELAYDRATEVQERMADDPDTRNASVRSLAVFTRQSAIAVANVMKLQHSLRRMLQKRAAAKSDAELGLGKR